MSAQTQVGSQCLPQIAEAWPLLRPHVREAIITLIDAELIRVALQQEGAFDRPHSVAAVDRVTEFSE